MSRFRRTTFVLLVVAVFAFLAAAAVNGGHGMARLSISAADKQRFQELLNSVDPKALHDVLHVAETKYQHGIFKEDKTAMEVVHVENAEAATRLLELAKRQVANNTSIPTETSVVATITPSTTSPITSPISIPTTPTLAPTPTLSENPTTPAPAPTTPVVASTTQPETITRTNTQAAPPLSTSAGQTIDSASPPPSSAAGSPTLPSAVAPPPSSSSEHEEPNTSSPTIIAPAQTTAISTSRQTSNVSPVRSSSTLATQVNPYDTPTTTSARSVTQQTIYTTTLANGAVETVTSITVVAGQADQTGGSSGSKSSSAKGSLQTNGASIKKVGINGLLGALGMVVVGAL